MIPSRLLTDRIAVLRRSSTAAEDEWGNPVQGSESVVVDGVPGYISLLNGSQVIEVGPSVSDHRIFLPVGVDVKVTDWIRVSPDDGRRFDVLDVNEPGPYPHHLEVLAKAVT